MGGDMLFGERLKQLREERGLNLKDLEGVVGLTDATLSRYENGLMRPKRTTIKVLAEYFGVSPVWLTGVEGEDKYSTNTEKSFKQIPTLGVIAAGQPILAQEHIEGYESVSRHSNIDFCLRVKGDSMMGARILDGDLVYIRQQPEVENGEIAVVIIDGCDATLKRFYRLNGSVILRAENPNYEDRVFTKKDMKQVSVIGKAVHFKSEVR